MANKLSFSVFQVSSQLGRLFLNYSCDIFSFLWSAAVFRSGRFSVLIQVVFACVQYCDVNALFLSTKKQGSAVIELQNSRAAVSSGLSRRTEWWTDSAMTLLLLESYHGFCIQLVRKIMRVASRYIFYAFYRNLPCQPNLEYRTTPSEYRG